MDGTYWGSSYRSRYRWQGDFLLNPVRESLSRQLLPVYRERIREIEVVSASLGDNGGVVGAVAGYFI